MNLVEAIADLRRMLDERDHYAGPWGDRSRLGPIDKAIAEQRAMIADATAPGVTVLADYADAPLIQVAVPTDPNADAESDALRRRIRLANVWTTDPEEM